MLILPLVAAAAALPMSDALRVEILGALAVGVSFIIYIPQVVLIWQMRNNVTALRGVSVPTYALMLATAAAWITYGVFLDSLWVAVSTFINIPLALVVGYLVWRARGIRDAGGECVI